MAAVDFLHDENPPTWVGLEPATLGAEGQRQTNHATQPGRLSISKVAFLHFFSPIWGKILGGPTGVFWRQKSFAKLRNTSFSKWRQRRKTLGNRMCQRGEGEMGKEQRLVSESGGGRYKKFKNHEMNGVSGMASGTPENRW
ncbi:hypothetical protein TNCV_5096021 [Trichonephila clavipes]|nr:hypothetical protein TNCV_5096021 [Trichonephila clavipes]